MKTHRIWALWLGALLLWGLSAAAQASLIGVLPATPGGTDYQAYYDSDTNLTWLADANYFKTQYDSNSGIVSQIISDVGSVTDSLGTHTLVPSDFNESTGEMTWWGATAWAQDLNIDGVTGWRLPDSDLACFGFNCTGSEMGNLFYNVLGGVADTDIATSHNSNYDLFSNVLSWGYWSGLEDPGGPDQAYRFLFNKGAQYEYFKAIGDYAWAVHSGNVASVPEPATLLLMGAGLVGLAARRRLALDSGNASHISEVIPLKLSNYFGRRARFAFDLALAAAAVLFFATTRFFAVARLAGAAIFRVFSAFFATVRIIG